MNSKNWTNGAEALSWTIETLADDITVRDVLITVANAITDVRDIDVRMNIYDACAQRIRSIILEKGGVDIAEYL